MAGVLEYGRPYPNNTDRRWGEMTKAERIGDVQRECFGNVHWIAQVTLCEGIFYTNILCASCLAKIKLIEGEEK